jgi:hexosaminidase
MVKYIREDLNLQIVPLVQVFSHLEYVLKRDAFRHLREEPDKMLSLCPLKDEAPDVIMDIIN